MSLSAVGNEQYSQPELGSDTGTSPLHPLYVLAARLLDSKSKLSNDALEAAYDDCLNTFKGLLEKDEVVACMHKAKASIIKVYPGTDDLTQLHVLSRSDILAQVILEFAESPSAVMQEFEQASAKSQEQLQDQLPILEKIAICCDTLAQALKGRQPTQKITGDVAAVDAKIAKHLCGQGLIEIYKFETGIHKGKVPSPAQVCAFKAATLRKWAEAPPLSQQAKTKNKLRFQDTYTLRLVNNDATGPETWSDNIRMNLGTNVKQALAIPPPAPFHAAASAADVSAMSAEFDDKPPPKPLLTELLREFDAARDTFFKLISEGAEPQLLYQNTFRRFFSYIPSDDILQIHAQAGKLAVVAKQPAWESDQMLCFEFTLAAVRQQLNLAVLRQRVAEFERYVNHNAAPNRVKDIYDKMFFDEFVKPLTGVQKAFLLTNALTIATQDYRLGRATGPTPASIAELMQMGYPAYKWIFKAIEAELVAVPLETPD